MSSTEVIPYAERVGALSVTDVRSQVNLIQQVMKDVMKKGEHYGIIPGTNKPSLLKAGAEKLCLTFRLDPQYEITQEKEGPHLTITSKCTLYHIPSSQRFGSGMGSCSTRESKYAYRKAQRKCPKCGAESIIKGKDFKGDGLPTGWLCFAKRGGCGAKFADGDESIEKQESGRVPNDDIADTYNTVLKMANKRSLVAAVLNATAASDIFTQDIEDVAAPDSQMAADHDITEDMPKSISFDQAIALEDALKASKTGKTKAKLLANVSKQYGSPITNLQQIKVADYADAMQYAQS